MTPTRMARFFSSRHWPSVWVWNTSHDHPVTFERIILELITRAFVSPQHEVVIFRNNAVSVYPIVTQAGSARP